VCYAKDSNRLGFTGLRQYLFALAGSLVISVIMAVVMVMTELPLTRRQQEMITTMVSVTNRCFY
jgi:hypothetical protein